MNNQPESVPTRKLVVVKEYSLDIGTVEPLIGRYSVDLEVIDFRGWKVRDPRARQALEILMSVGAVTFDGVYPKPEQV